MKDNFDNNAYKNEGMKWIKVPDKCCLVPVRLTSSRILRSDHVIRNVLAAWNNEAQGLGKAPLCTRICWIRTMVVLLKSPCRVANPLPVIR